MRFTVLTAIGIQIMMIITIADTLTAVTIPILTMVTRSVTTETGMGSDAQFQRRAELRGFMCRKDFPYAFEWPPNRKEREESMGRQSLSDGSHVNYCKGIGWVPALLPRP